MTDSFWGNYTQGLGAISGVGQQLTARQAGGQLAGGNTRGAASTLLQSGDLQNGLALEERAVEQDAAERTRQVQFTMQATQALRRAREAGRDVLAAYDSMAPAFQQMGTEPAQIAQMRQALETSHDQFLQSVEQIAGQQARELEIINYGSGRGGAAIDRATGEIVNEFAPERDPMNVGGVLLDPTSGDVILDTREPKYQTIANADGSTSVVAIDQPAPVRGGVSAGGGSTDPERILDGVIRREGGFVARDGRSGAPANFGINQRANPDVDVAKLTEDRARQIYRERYINPIVEVVGQVPALEAVIDFGVNAGVGRALDFWRRSGGDIDEFNRLRLAHYRSLPDYEQNGRSWERRVAETTPGRSGAEVPVRGGSRVVAQGTGGAAARLLTEEEKRAEGLPVGGVYERQADGSTRQVTAPTAGRGGAGGGQYDPQTRGSLQAARNAANAAAARAQQARRFMALNTQRGTGPAAGALGPVASVDPTYAEMLSIGAALIPGQREPGSGPMSDKDIDLYSRAVLSVNNPGPTNRALADVIIAQADRDAAYAAFLDEYAPRNGNLLGATEDWTAYVNANPLFEERGRNTTVRSDVQPWRDFMGYGERQRGGQSGGGATIGGGSGGRAESPVQGVPAQLWQSSSEGQRSYWQQNPPRGARGSATNPLRLNPADPTVSYGNVRAGQYYLDPNGVRRQRR